MSNAEDPLLRELRSGSARAFDAIYARYRNPLFAFLVRLCGERALAEDLFQNTWLKLARSARALRPDTELKAWLFCVARNEYRSHRRFRRADLRRLLTIGADPVLRAASCEPLHTVCDAERALARLSPADRELLLLSVAGLEPREAAAVLGVSYSALRQRLARARAQLAALVSS